MGSRPLNLAIAANELLAKSRMPGEYWGDRTLAFFGIGKQSLASISPQITTRSWQIVGRI